MEQEHCPGWKLKRFSLGQDLHITSRVTFDYQVHRCVDRGLSPGSLVEILADNKRLSGRCHGGHAAIMNFLSFWYFRKILDNSDLTRYFWSFPNHDIETEMAILLGISLLLILGEFFGSVVAIQTGLFPGYSNCTLLRLILMFYCLRISREADRQADRRRPP